MELRHIRYFAAAAGALHFGRAAEILAVTRPAVSQTVADLEMELGVKLFRREAHKVQLTAAGETFLKHALAILQDVETATQTTRRVGEGKAGLLRIGYGSLGLRHPVFREGVKKMGVLYPETDLVLKEQASSLQLDEIRLGRLDAGFVYVAREEGRRTMSLPESGSIGDLNSLVLDAGHIGVALPVDHPLAGREELDIGELSGEGFIVVGRSLVNPFFPFTPKIVQQVSNISTQINLISVGMGVGLIVTSSQLQFPGDIRVARLRQDTFRTELRLVWPSGPPEAILGNFISVLRGLGAAAAEARDGTGAP
ncbi:LysR family transcriptional regulator [Mangrovicoccus ximenensis]|uniref:LysR family transcriptional regulator n=1 Tax=Mangrovicoccus ximenensis TaxID=1911570 RepID=UPI0011AE36EF|nr:LysR family transcriptional regulator [Mangrovicoccus ximenensis]